MWIENGRVFAKGFEWKISMVVRSCNSVFYKIILEMYLRKYLTYKSDNKFQNSVSNFRRCISEMSNMSIIYQHICWKLWRYISEFFFNYLSRMTLIWCTITLVHDTFEDVSPKSMKHFNIFTWWINNIFVH